MPSISSAPARETEAEKAACKRYVLAVLSGLVPSDALFDAIYETVATHGGCEFDRRSASIDIVAMAADIKAIRAKATGAQ